MRKTLNRALACFLAAALLISCCISGLILPAAADTPITNLFPNGDLEGTLVGDGWNNAGKSQVVDGFGFGGGKALEVIRNASSDNTIVKNVTLEEPLVTGKVYVFRYKVKGGNGRIWWNDSVSPQEFYASSEIETGWKEVFCLFKIREDKIAQMAEVNNLWLINGNTINGTEAASVYFDDFQIYEYKAGMNLVPGSDGAALPITHDTPLLSNFSVALAKDGDNAVWQFTNANASAPKRFSFSGFESAMAVGNEIEISFRYKGVSSASGNAGSTEAQLAIPDANNAEFVVSPVNSAADADGWKTCTATLKVKNFDSGYTLTMRFTHSEIVYVDDFVLAQKVSASVDITDATKEIAVGDEVTLTATTVPAGTAVTWTSSDPAIATVDNTGKVTGVKEGTATITATVDGNKSDTCAVTVTAAAPITYNGLFPNGDLEGTLVGDGWNNSGKSQVVAGAGFGGGKALEVIRNASSDNTVVKNVTLEEPLVAGKVYVFRYKVKGGNGRIWWNDSVSPQEFYESSETETGWKEVFCLFKIREDKIAQMAEVNNLWLINGNTINGTEAASVYFDDFKIEEYQVGMNLVPGSDGAALPITHVSHLLSNFSVALSTDGDNAVWNFTNANATPAKQFNFGGFEPAMAVGNEIEISFRYKGVDNAEAEAQLAIPDANNAEFVVSPVNSAADENGWKTCTATFKVKKFDSAWTLTMRFTHATNVLVDDFVLAQKVSVDITEETKAIEVGDEVTLIATTVPAGTAVTWTSSDPAIATVDNTGKVTGVKEGTATITATIIGGKSDTCTVTVAALSAPITYNGLFPNGNLEGTLVGDGWNNSGKSQVVAGAGFGGGKALEVIRNASSDSTVVKNVTLKEPLVAGKVYVFRYKVKGGNGRIWWNDSVSPQEFYESSETETGWKEVFCLFKIREDKIAQMAVVNNLWLINGNTINGTEAASVYFDDFKIEEYQVGMNLVPNADGAALPITHVSHLLSNFSVALSTDGDNAVWNFTNANGTAKRFSFSGFEPAMAVGNEIEISFRYKGVDNAEAEAQLAIPDANNAEFVVSPVNSAADENGWKTCTATFKVKKFDSAWTLTMRFTHATNVLVDDFVLAQKVSVDITEETATIAVDENVTLSAATFPAGTTVTWTSSDPAIATVDNTGKVTGVALGEATITATITTADGEKSDTCKVFVTIPATGMTMSKTQLHLVPNGYQTLAVTATPAAASLGTITWSSNNAAVATVNNGKVTAVGGGTATITATNGILSAECVVTVDAYGNRFTGGDMESDSNAAVWGALTSEVGAIIPEPGNEANHVLSVNSGKDFCYRFGGLFEPNMVYTFTGRVKGSVHTTVETGAELEWAFTGGTLISNSPNRWAICPTTGTDGNTWVSFEMTFQAPATVSQDWSLRIANFGQTFGYFDDLKLVKRTPPALESLTIASKDDLDLIARDDTLDLSVSQQPIGIDVPVGTLTWTSSNTAVATVEKTGDRTATVNAVKAGEAVITVKNENGISDTFTVKVLEPATAIDITESTYTFGPEAAHKLTVNTTPVGSYAGTLEWTSTDDTVVKVENGVITGVKPGTAVITATSSLNSAVTDSITVVVTEYGEMLTGGDFESDTDLGHWASVLDPEGNAGGSIIEDPTNPGNHILSFKPCPNTVQFWHYFGFYKQMKLEPETTYVVTGKVMGNAKPAIGHGNMVYAYPNTKPATGAGNASYPYDNEYYYVGESKDSWNEFTFTFKTKSNATSGVDQIFGLGNFGTGICYFDDLTLRKQEPQTVTEITLNKTEATYGVGVTTQLNFTTTPDNADLSTLEWSSSNPSVATVDQNGKVVTVATGTTTITVKTSDTVKATCKLTVVKDATAFSLSSNALSLISGGSDVLTVIATPYGAEVGALTWSSSNTAVATVDNNGKVTAVSDGTATITVTNGTLSATCAVKVSDYGELLIGGDFQDTSLSDNWAAMVNGTAAEVVDDPYVDGNKYMALKAGQTTGVYTGLALKDDTLYKFSLRAKGYVANISINSALAAAYYPADTYYHKTVSDGDNWTTTTIYFRTKEAVNASDIFSFKGHNDGATCIDDISLTEVPALTGISISDEATLDIAPGNSVTLIARPIPSDSFIEGTVVWSSADGTIASVSQSGELTAGVEGTTTVSATVSGYAPATVTVNSDYYAPLVRDGDFAKNNVAWECIDKEQQKNNKSGVYEGIGENGTNGFRLLTQGVSYYKGPAMELIPNNTYKLSIRYKSKAMIAKMHEVYFSAGCPVLILDNTKGEWTTIEKVFTVPATFKKSNYQLCFSALMETTLQDDVVIDSIDIRMYDSGVDATSAYVNPPTLQMTPGQKQTYVLTVAPNKANTNFMTWTSSNENVVIVNNGVITAVGAGTATVTASIPTSSGVPVTAQSVVTVVGDEAFIKNGTFDIEGDTSWTLENATVVPRAGLVNSNALAMTNTSVVTQTLTGLKPGSVYLATVSTNSPNLVINAKIKKDGVDTPYMTGKTPISSGWTQTVFEFVVPNDYDGSALTFELTAEGSNTGYVDNIYLTEGFSEADLVVSDLIWNDGETQMKPGTPVNFTVVLVNIGTEATKSDRDIVVEIRVNNKVIRTLVHKGGLGATDMNRLTTLTTDPADPWLATEGELVISAHVNTTLSVLESNTKNNGMQTYIRVAEEALVAPQAALDGGFNKLVFSDDFDTANVDENYTGDYGYKWYLSDLDGTPSGDKTEYELTDKGIRLKAKSESTNWLLISMDTATGAGWEGFTHGYMEFRARFKNDHDEGTTHCVGPQIWSLDTEFVSGRADHWVELDWMEYWHSDGADPFWAISLHETITGEEAAADWNGVKQNYSNAPNNYMRDPEFDIGTNDWVTVGYRWEKGLLIGYVNGVECYRQRWGGEDGPVPEATVHSGDINPDTFEYLDQQKLQLILNADYRWPIEIDYIRVWQSDGTLESKPVLDNTFLADHMTDADGNLYTSVTADNYEAIIAGLADWVELSEDQQALVNELLIAAGGKEYTVLLFEAQTLANTVDSFVSYYAQDEYGEPYTVVDDSNYDWILLSLEEWEAFTDIERAAINAKVKELCGMTFDEMIEAAAAYESEEESGDESGDESEDVPEDDTPSKDVTGNDFVDDNLIDEDGNVIGNITADNYEDILDLLDKWESLTDDEKAEINDVLTQNGGIDFETLVQQAQELKETVDNFLSEYVFDENGEFFTEVTAENVEVILAAKEAWEALSDVERAAINKKVFEAIGMTFDELLLQAEEFGVSSPEDGVPFPAVALVGLLLGGATLFTTKKRRDEE